MASIVRMPSALAGVTEAAIQSWLVEVGDSVEVGIPIAEIETEKAVIEYEAEAAGTIGRVLAKAGATLVVGEPIAVLLAPGESDDAIDAVLAEVGHASAVPAVETEPSVGEAAIAATVGGSEAPAATTPAAATGESGAEATAVPTPVSGARRFISPLARRLARQRGVDLGAVEGTGPGGRITRRDVDAVPANTEVGGTNVPDSAPSAAVPTSDAAAAAPPQRSAGPHGAESAEIPHTGMRRAIARRLTESKSTVPHFYLEAECRVDELIALRTGVNEAAAKPLSLNDFIVKAVALALVDVPEANAIWGEDAITRFSGVDLAIAVSIDGGLVTPVVRGVERLTLSELSASIADLAERARAGRLKQRELDGGSFSVSNLGMFGITAFSAIINPPHAGILAVGRAVPKPVVIDGELAVGTVMTVALSADHRVIDGAVAAQWLGAFQRRIENPLSILI
ncbi:dihydrolipoamide acetyltransferase family protein [Schumannella sp. 10F1B-5-1]|uniref:dihydrolipoamide acetyltransferase family protein n=1 Tax=Schumannella sp. 10F1B-5-1 TaxID=2590780 RepID=UPI001130ECE8|nr:dihydrolipoamide acetyltransferase family protein [Schumannella sp. 10F1B-5-1]TPW72940.1 2-oxo acid dehydrogenase subunit E2 [Schumannella sp. 10F1B-5-1]